MMICTGCKAQYQDGKKFCQKCGSRLAPEQSMSPEVMAQRQILETRLAQEPENGGLLAEYTEFLGKVGLYQEALTRLRGFLDTHPTDLVARRALAGTLEALKAWDEAAAQLLVLISRQPEDLELQEALVRCYLAAGRRASAIEVLNRLTSSPHSSVNHLIQLRDLLQNEGRFDALPELCNRILMFLPDDVSSWRTLADALVRAGDREGAQTAFANLLQLDPRDSRACVYVGSRRYEQVKGDAARLRREVLPLLELAVQDKMRLTEQELNHAQIYLASTKLITGSVEPALLEEVNRLATSRAYWKRRHAAMMVDALERVARIRQDGGDPGPAISALRLALEIEDRIGLREALAAIYAARGDAKTARNELTEALQDYKQALETYPGNQLALDRIQLLKSRQRTRRQLWNGVGLGVLVILAIAAGELYFGVRSVIVTVDRPATITISNWLQQVSTDTSTKAKTRRLPPGPYHILVESPGYQTLEADGRAGFTPGVDRLDYSLLPIASEESKGRPSSISAEAASPAPGQRSGDDSTSEADIRSLLERWRQAQSSQDTRAYASCYSPDFHGIKRVKGGFTYRYDLNGWLTDRRKMIIGATWLAVEIEGLRILPGALRNEPNAIFTQVYRSNSYSDRGEKHMTFRKRGGQTKITFEEMKWSTPL